MITVYFYKVPNLINSEESEFLNTFFTQEELQKPKLMPEVKHLTSLFSKAIAKTVAAKETGISAKEIKIKTSATKKPFFENLENIHFNISHSDDTVAVAFCDEEIGVDIEKIKTANFKIAERFFSKDEQEYVSSHSDKDLAFFEIWTAKEAYFKQSGKGIGTDFSKVSVKNAVISPKITTFERNGFTVSVCCDKKDEIVCKEFKI